MIVIYVYDLCLIKKGECHTIYYIAYENAVFTWNSHGLFIFIVKFFFIALKKLMMLRSHHQNLKFYDSQIAHKFQFETIT